MAKTEVDYKWKRPANDFKFCASILQKSLKIYYGLHSLQKFTWYLPLDVPGALCVSEGI